MGIAFLCTGPKDSRIWDCLAFSGAWWPPRASWASSLLGLLGLLGLLRPGLLGLLVRASWASWASSLHGSLSTYCRILLLVAPST